MELGPMAGPCIEHRGVCRALFLVGNLHVLPGFVFQIAGSVVAFGLLFFPAVQAYFTATSAHRGAFSVRATLSTGLLLLSAFTGHSIVMGAYRKTIPIEVRWIGLGVFLLLTLVLSMLARWQLAASIREISALGVAV
ncbi:hypothetical protein PPGU19_098710 (plasmid) [Paraburkholderia sp. PGU19]|uniref:hypothetical protein n=1 Tax=Paraburkholderia sp. PGU19 TaxID=2735434 RepID=UPI0015DA084F|nr:hypothetical protein [Paraburkholderia sp. PGU19]BCG05303.1 hypothetical protein PPGU19_098710 [Paraburkholderia sp. PGU19]